MTSFTSGKISHDPRAWIDVNGNRHSSHRAQLRKGQTLEAFYAKQGTIYAPRPEFDHHNPILAAFRGEVAGLGMPQSLKYFDETAGPSTDTPEEIDHARRVLTKLANLTETETS